MKKYILPLVVLAALAGWFYFEKFILPSLSYFEGRAMGREVGKIMAERMTSNPSNTLNAPLEHAVPLTPRVSFSGKKPGSVSSSLAVPPAPSN